MFHGRKSNPSIAREEEVQSIRRKKREGAVEDRVEKLCEVRRELEGVTLMTREE